ncbi:MAG TPA: hypothetical protein PKW35_14355, partial [Nannocystaceae bacterium]|nr:hypothetical protein [Nannocystaceae bacterium]
QDDTDACLSTCKAASCGDGSLHAGVEACDGAALGGQLCSELGLPAGRLGCDGSCELDTSMCTCGLDPTPTAGQCPAACTGGCTGDTCTIACNGNAACKSATLTCPPGWICEVECNGSQACAAATVLCPDQACSLTCSQQSACAGTTIECGEGSCDLHCGAGKSVCLGAQFHCGPNKGAVSCTSPIDPPTLVPSADSMCTCEATGCG